MCTQVSRCGSEAAYGRPSTPDADHPSDGNRSVQQGTLPADSSGAVKDSKKQPGVPDKAVRIVKTNGEQFWSYDDKVNWCGQLSFKNGQTIPYEKLKEVDISPAERGGFNVRAAL